MDGGNRHNIDWDALERIRAGYLNGAAQGDYWRSESDLASYDATYAMRIGWKWEGALSVLARRNALAPLAKIPLWIDFGCGTGMASRTFFRHAPFQNLPIALSLWDRSPLAREFAKKKVQQELPQIALRSFSPDHALTEPYGVLASHLGDELAPEARSFFLRLLQNSQGFLWLEPGTQAQANTLVNCREVLRESHQILGPCPHQGPCGLLARANAPHTDWCHGFARPPAFVFQDRFWGEFSRRMGIDLRSLPLSFLAGVRTNAVSRETAPLDPVERSVVLGRPRKEKAVATLVVCREQGIAQEKVRKRDAAQDFKTLQDLDLFASGRDE